MCGAGAAALQRRGISAEGLEGLFHSTEEVDGFVGKLSAALERRSHPNGGGVE